MTDAKTTTLISLFHTEEQAHAAIQELQSAGIPASSIQRRGAGKPSDLNSFQDLELPKSDLKMLSDGIESGGTVLVVTAADALASKAEAIFKAHHAHKVDEHVVDTGVAATAASLKTPAKAAALAATGDVTIPIVEEELMVGKRAVQTGGVRVISRVTETPVEKTVTLHEEHATINRRPVNRSASESDFDTLSGQSIEILNRDEEAVVSKKANVVEEVVIGKEASDRTERVTDTVRKTEVEVEQVATDEFKTKKTK